MAEGSLTKNHPKNVQALAEGVERTLPAGGPDAEKTGWEYIPCFVWISLATVAEAGTSLSCQCHRVQRARIPSFRTWRAFSLTSRQDVDLASPAYPAVGYVLLGIYTRPPSVRLTPAVPVAYAELGMDTSP